MSKQHTRASSIAAAAFVGLNLIAIPCAFAARPVMDKSIHGSCSAVYQFTGGQYPNVDMILTLDCVLSRLGRSTGVALQSVDFSAGTLDTEVTYVAANGDELYAHVTGQLVPPTLCPGELAFVTTEEYVGGTGRFDGAAGESVNVGCATQPDAFGAGTGWYTTKGALVY